METRFSVIWALLRQLDTSRSDLRLIGALRVSNRSAKRCRSLVSGGNVIAPNGETGIKFIRHGMPEPAEHSVRVVTVTENDEFKDSLVVEG